VTFSLSSICEFIVDCEHKTAPLVENGYPSIRTPNVGRGRLILGGVNRIDEDTYKLWTKRAIPQVGDLIIAREAPVGNVALITRGQVVCLGQRTVLVRPNRKVVDPAFLVYFLLGDEVQAYFRSCSIGSTVPHLNMKDIRSLPILSLPDISIQRRIGGILSAYDDLIEVNTRRIEVLEEMARGIFEDRLGRIDLSDLPDDWRIVPLGDLVEERRDAVLPSAISGDTPYVGLEHLPRRSTTLLDYGRANDVSSTKFQFHDGDILFGKIRPYFHKVAVASFAGVASSDAIVMRPISSAARALAICLTSSDRFIAHAVQTSNGTKMPRANWNVLQKYKLAVPPEPLLDRFAQIINANIQFCSRLAAINEKLRAARDLLLPKLISGEIDLERAGRDADKTIRRVAAA
jgi:type I restriction enzyme S subunit